MGDNIVTSPNKLDERKKKNQYSMDKEKGKRPKQVQLNYF